MKVFLTRKVFGIPVWLWFVGGSVLALVLREAWMLLIGAGAGMAAFRQASREVTNKAYDMIRNADKLEDLFDAQDEAAGELADDAEQQAIKKVQSKQDDQSKFME